MSAYSFTDRVPSCIVDKELLKTIETYFVKELPTKLKTLDDDASYSIAITDGFGTEKLNSIDSYSPKRLPDTTQSILIHWRSGYKAEPRVDLMLRFDANYFMSLLSVDINGENARDIAVGIRDRFRFLMEPYRTLNWLFNPFSLPVASTFAGFAAWAAAFLSLGTISSNRIAGGVIAIVAVIAAWYWISSAMLRPFVAFDSNVQGRRSAVWKWISLGFLTFIVFGSLLPPIRKLIFGS